MNTGFEKGDDGKNVGREVQKGLSSPNCILEALMLSIEQSRVSLERMFGEQFVADLAALQTGLDTASPMSVFRRRSYYPKAFSS